MRKFLLTLIVAAVVPATIALAQTTTPPAEAPPPGAKAVPKPKAKAAPIVQSEESVECSKQADAKGLHGQEPLRFRANCKSKLAKAKKT